MGVPAPLDYGPIGFIAVHGGDHTAPSGGDSAVAALVPQHGAKLFQRGKIIQRTSGPHITSVQQTVDAHPGKSLFTALLQKRVQVVDMGVNIPI